MFELQEIDRPIAKLKVVGVGGGGGNAINSMIAANIYGVEFIAVNTDKQHLDASLAPVKIQIGSQVTRGLGAGADPELGRMSAVEDRTAIAAALEGADMVFITAGMGGGTGTGASPIVAGVARELGIITVGVVTRPFFYEGKKRAIRADEGIREIRQNVDTLIVIPNDRINAVAGKGTPLLKSFAIANDVLRQAIQGISDLILIPGLINLDFADVKSIMQDGGRAVIGVGTGKGEGGAFEAAKKAISNQLLEESSIEGARGILINITGGINMPLDAVQEAASLIHDSSADDANIILGAVINPDMEDEVRVTVIATGFEEKLEKAVLPNIKSWTPTKEPVKLGATDRILSKTMSTVMESPAAVAPPAPAQPAPQPVLQPSAQPVSQPIFHPAAQEIPQPVQQPQVAAVATSALVEAAARIMEPELPKAAEPQPVVSQTPVSQQQMFRPVPEVKTPEAPVAAPPVQPVPLKESMLPPEDEYDIPAFMRKRL